jgi:hypothetical protein
MDLDRDNSENVTTMRSWQQWCCGNSGILTIKGFLLESLWCRLKWRVFGLMVVEWMGVSGWIESIDDDGVRWRKSERQDEERTMTTSGWVTYARSWLDLVNWTKRVLDRVVFTDFTLRSVLTANFRLVDVVCIIFAARPRVCAVLCETSKQAVNLSVLVHQDGGSGNSGHRS